VSRSPARECFAMHSTAKLPDDYDRPEYRYRISKKSNDFPIGEEIDPIAVRLSYRHAMSLPKTRDFIQSKRTRTRLRKATCLVR
jgi:hypothetical protein